MNLIESLREHLMLKYPKATIELTPPLRLDGSWALDVDISCASLAIEWSAASGFGISSTSNDNFGEAPDEIFASLESAQRRIDQLLNNKERTAPHIGRLLSRLRESKGLTQSELASRLGIRQATISGLERRTDVQLSTLRRLVDVLGGELEIFAAFPKARFRIQGSSLGDLNTVETMECSDVQAPIRAKVVDDAAFEYLHASNCIPAAHKIADSIKARGSVISFV